MALPLVRQRSANKQPWLGPAAVQLFHRSALLLSALSKPVPSLAIIMVGGFIFGNEQDQLLHVKRAGEDLQEEALDPGISVGSETFSTLPWGCTGSGASSTRTRMPLHYYPRDLLPGLGRQWLAGRPGPGGCRNNLPRHVEPVRQCLANRSFPL